MRHARNRLGILYLPVLLLLTIALSPPAAAQEPEVTSADPSAAEQETFDLEVTVGGDNFGADSGVEFLVTGTENPGGIHVKNVKRRGPKTLKVTIDVAADAVVDYFDIRVTSNGRKGRGTELFRVFEKSNTPNEKASDLVVTFGGDPLHDVRHDGQTVPGYPLGTYLPGPHDRMRAGSPELEAPGLSMTLGGKGQNPRELEVRFYCQAVPAAGAAGEIDDCVVKFGEDRTFSRSVSAGSHVRPYHVNCPEPLPTGECPDIYSMPPDIEGTQLMSYRLGAGVYRDSEGKRHTVGLEATSALGGPYASSPGRCLMNHPDPDALMALLCSDPSRCNIEITAWDQGDQHGVGAGDGRNDEWLIVADNVVVLICDFFKDVVIGQTTLTFWKHAIKLGE